MQAKSFKLFMCCLGNGTTVCNSAVMERGDYKTIAHISNAGNVTYYVPESYIPPEEKQRIENTAIRDREKFIDRLDLEIKYQPHYALERMIDELPYSECRSFFKEHKGLTVPELIEALKPLYLAHC